MNNKKIKKKLHDVIVQRNDFYDTADNVKSFLSIARFLVVTKDYGVCRGLLSDNDCVVLDDFVSDIISNCCSMLSEVQDNSK